MKKICLVGITVIAAVFVSLLFLPGHAFSGTNILRNYSFEENDGWGTEPYFWEEMGGSSSVKGVVEANAHQGSWAFNIGNDYGPDQAGSYTLQVLCDPANPDNLYPVIPGERVIFSMWMQGEANYTGNALIKIEFFDYDRRVGYSGPPLKTIISTGLSGSFNYTKRTVTAVIPNGTISVVAVCSSEGMEIGSGYSAVNFDEGNVEIIPEENLLLNISFEDNTGWGGDADYWGKGGNNSFRGTIQANAHDGSWAFNIGNDGGLADAGGYCLQILRDPDNPDNPFPVDPGEIFTFTMWMQGEANYTGNALLKIEFYDYNRSGGYIRAPIETFTSTAHTGEFAYFPEAVVGAAPENTVSIAVVCSSEAMQTGSGYSAVNFDDGRVLIQAPIIDKETIDFNGSWQIAPTQTELPPEELDYTRTVNVPGLVDLAEPPIVGVKDCWAYDYFWYKKTFTLTPSQSHSYAFLKIGQARYVTDVWLNGTHIGNYIGCFTSHKYDASEVINYNGENELIVRVGQKRLLPVYSAVGYDYEEDTWVPGIWGNISLSLLNNPIIERVQIIPHINTGIAEARITVKNLNFSAYEISLSAQVFKKSGGSAASEEIIESFSLSSFEEATFSLEVPISGVNFWSPDDPFLYELVSKIEFAGAETDNLTTTFGMREFKIVGSDFYLNNHRIFLKGGNICFHRFLSDPDRAGRPWDDDWIKAVLIDIPKAYNFNFFRMHMGHANNKWYDIADEHGILLEDEWGFRAPVKYPYNWVPGGPGYGSEDQIRREFTQWIYDNCNHPSIIIWDAQNEPHDDGYQSRDMISDIIIPEMKEVDPTRPWECGINANVDFEPGGWNPIDFSEDHPYIYSMGPVLNDEPFGYSRSVDGMRDSEEPTILNEYLWFWLNSEGEAVGFTLGVLSRWLGRNTTAEACMEHQSLIASDLTELWRRLDIDGVAPFCYLSSSEAGTTNWLTDVVNPSVEKVLPVMYALKDAYAPFGVSIELWDRHFFPSETRDINVYIFNDSPQYKSGTLNYKITSKDETNTFFEGSMSVGAEPSNADMLIETISWDMPSELGSYYLLAELVEDSEIVARSKKIIHVSDVVMPDNLAAAKIMVYDPDNEILDYLTSLSLNVSNYNSSTLSQQDILILGEGVLFDPNYNSRMAEISDFVETGHSLIVIEPSNSITSYEKQEYSLLSDLSLHMNRREDKFEGGYDSYCFVEELKLSIKEADASSVESASYTPDKAIDNNLSTRWSSEPIDPQWLCLDLGESVKFNKVVLSWENAYGKSYKIQVSNNKTDWTDIYSTATGDGGVDELIFAAPVTARYVRMYGTERGTEWGYSLYEFEVYGSLGSLWNNIDGEHLKMFNGGWGGEMISQCDVELQTNRKTVLARSGLDLKYSDVVEAIWGDGVVFVSRIQLRGRLTEDADPGTDLYSRRVDVIARQYLLNSIATYLDTSANWQRLNNVMPFLHVKEATATSVEKDIGGRVTNHTPDKTIDNDYSTRWSSENSDPQWICLDLGKSTTFNKVILHWESAYAASYQIQVSNDNQDWTNIVYSTTTGDGGIDEIKFSPVLARYIRMFGEERIFADYGYSLYEFRVYLLENEAVASSEENEYLTADKAMDGYLTTRWASNCTDNEWIYIDFGKQIIFNTVKLNWETAYGKQYEIQISDDGLTWTTVYTEANGDGGIDILSVGNQTARFVKMQGIQRATAYGYSLWEFETTISTIAVSSSEENSYLSSDKTIDSDFTTRWSSEHSDPQWIYLSFKSPETFNTVILNWEAAYGKQYEIQISDDAQNWTTVYTETDGNGGVDEIDIGERTFRYIRMYGTERGTPWGYSLYEFEVY
ncbi:MAG: discoidin domain-containing protein [Candidatus Aureabacteria bacterium]|nr:discoidin domain-containing protein [Candidatus Auribacterota bacterium]